MCSNPKISMSTPFISFIWHRMLFNQSLWELIDSFKIASLHFDKKRKVFIYVYHGIIGYSKSTSVPLLLTKVIQLFPPFITSQSFALVSKVVFLNFFPREQALQKYLRIKIQKITVYPLKKHRSIAQWVKFS